MKDEEGTVTADGKPITPEQLADKIVCGVISRAVDGDTVAADWLEARGYVKLPSASGWKA